MVVVETFPHYTFCRDAFRVHVKPLGRPCRLAIVWGVAAIAMSNLSHTQAVQWVS